MNIVSKLPNVGTTIFTVMSNLATEYGAINLSQGFPNFDPPEGLIDRVSHYLHHGKNQYAPMSGIPALRKVLAKKAELLYGASIDPDLNITITSGATQALFTAILAFIHVGDEVILIEPAYDCYRPAIELAGGIPVVYELEGPEYKINWESLSRLVTAKTRMIFINTPQNPIGRTFKQEDLIELEKISSKADLLVLSDEVYEHLIFDNQMHQSVMRFPKLFSRSMAVYSFGKTFHSTGWKMGHVVAPDHLMREFRKVHQFNVFSCNSFIQYALADYMEGSDSYLSLPDFYQRKRDFFTEVMKGSRLKPLLSEGTYFQLYDYSDISLEPDIEFARRMTCEYGVAAIPVSVFYSSGRQEKVVRLCFAKTEKLLSKAGELLQKI